MTLPVKLPKLPSPPDKYNKRYMDQLLKTLELYFQELNATGPLKCTTLNASAMPSSPLGLRTGDLYQINGDVYIVNDSTVVVVPTSVSATASVGTVTVSAQRTVDIAVTGVSATGEVGSPFVTTASTVTVVLTGLSATGELGTGFSVTANSSTSVGVTGVAGTGAVGAPTVTIIPRSQNIPLTGFGMTASLGAVTVTIIPHNISVPVTGVAGTMSVGTVTVTASSTGGYTEDFTTFSNPERGFYTDMGDATVTAFDQTALTNIRTANNISMVRANFYLRDYIAKPLDSTFLTAFTNKMTTVRNAGLKAIARFSYNSNSGPTPASNNTSVTPLPIPATVFNISTYGGGPAQSAATNVAAWNSAVAACKANGGGTIMFNLVGTYAMGNRSGSSVVFYSDQLTNTLVDFNGCSFTMNTTDVSMPIFFHSDYPVNVTFQNGTFSDTGTDLNVNWRGAVCFRVDANTACSNFKLWNNTVSNVVTYFASQPSVRYVYTGFDINGTVSNAYYGCNPNFTGRNSKVRLVCTNVKRGFIGYGVQNWDINIKMTCGAGFSGSNALVELATNGGTTTNDVVDNNNVYVEVSGIAQQSAFIHFYHQQANNAGYIRNCNCRIVLNNLSGGSGYAAYRFNHELPDTSTPANTARSFKNLRCDIDNVSGGYAGILIRNSTISTSGDNSVFVSTNASISGLPAYFQAIAPTQFSEPSLPRILHHINSLVTEMSTANNLATIAAVELGFVGADGLWGNSDHFGGPGTNSALLRPLEIADRKAVSDAMLAFGNGSTQRQLLLRYPHMKRLMYGNTAVTDAQAYQNTGVARIGHYDDNFVSDSTDNGTFGDAAIPAYLAQESKWIMRGGKSTAFTSPRSLCPTATSELAQYHWSYLDHDNFATTLSNWQSGGCFTTIEQKLGYRLRLDAFNTVSSAARNASIAVSGTITNVGYAAPMNTHRIYLVFRNISTSADTSVELTAVDCRLWLPGANNFNQNIIVPNTLTPGAHTLLLRIGDATTVLATSVPHAIRLANVSLWESATGYNVLNLNMTIT